MTHWSNVIAAGIHALAYAQLSREEPSAESQPKVRLRGTASLPYAPRAFDTAIAGRREFHTAVSKLSSKLFPVIQSAARL